MPPRLNGLHGFNKVNFSTFFDRRSIFHDHYITNGMWTYLKILRDFEDVLYFLTYSKSKNILIYFAKVFSIPLSRDTG